MSCLLVGFQLGKPAILRMYGIVGCYVAPLVCGASAMDRYQALENKPCASAVDGSRKLTRSIREYEEPINNIIALV